jgi:hypothetical protein
MKLNLKTVSFDDVRRCLEVVNQRITLEKSRIERREQEERDERIRKIEQARRAAEVLANIEK